MNDFNSNFLTLQAAFFTLGRASVPQVSTTYLAIYLVVCGEVSREPEALVQTHLAGFIGFCGNLAAALF